MYNIEFIFNNKKLNVLTLLSVCSKLFTVRVRRFLKYRVDFIFLSFGIKGSILDL